MSGDIFSIDLLLRNAILVHTHGGQHSSCPGIDLCTSVAHDANNNLFPGILSPGLAAIPGIHKLNVFDHTHHCPREKLVLLVVHGNHNEEFGMPWFGEELLSQCKLLIIKVSWIASRGGVSHVSIFVSLGRLDVVDLIEQSWRYWTIEDEVAFEQLDFFDRFPSANRRGGRRWLIVCILDIMLRLLDGGWHLMWIWPVCIVRGQHWPCVHLILPVLALVSIVFVQGSRIVERCDWSLWVIWLVIVCIVVVFWIEGVAMTAWLRCWVIRMSGFVAFIVAVGAGNILHGVLRPCQRRRSTHFLPSHTVGCACNLSPALPATGPIGISK